MTPFVPVGFALQKEWPGRRGNPPRKTSGPAGPDSLRGVGLCTRDRTLRMQIYNFSLIGQKIKKKNY